MYREKIREYYDHLSRSYRKVADYIMSNYYDVAFMTAAQLAYAVGVDTTTVVRFSQRLGYNGYPDLLQDVREQVKSEIYAAYEPKPLAPEDPAGVFKDRIEQERQNLHQMLVQNPPDHLGAVARLFESVERIVVVGEGYAETAAEMIAQQFRHRGVHADYLPNDAVKKAATLMLLNSRVLVIGVSATAYGRDVARAMEFARARGAKTLGIIGSLASPVNRMSDLIIYAPTEAIGPLPSIVALVAALSVLVTVAAKESEESVDRHLDAFEATYQFLTQEDVITALEAARVPEEA
jgi:DNA-binding MurR/RpiR family transcriptional regulator